MLSSCRFSIGGERQCLPAQSAAHACAAPVRPHSSSRPSRVCCRASSTPNTHGRMSSIQTNSMSHLNGTSPTHQQVAQQQPPSTELLLPGDAEQRVQQLRTSLPQQDLVQHLSSNVDQLLSTVRDQQAALQQQQAELQQLRNTVSQLQQQQTSLQQQQQQQQQQPTDQLHNTQHRQQLVGWSSVRPFDAQKAALVAATPSLSGDRRSAGMFDARYHSTSRGAVPSDPRMLPDRIILVRHAQSEGNVNQATYTYLPDPQVPLTEYGRQQAREAGEAIRSHMQALHCDNDFKLYFYTSPYKRGLQTYEGIRAVFASSQVLGVQEDVQLREQDFGNFQDAEGKQREKAERLRFGRFFYRFPNGESGADVYDRITVFMDHLVRDINAGRFPPGTSLVLVTHGLALRIWLMRWFHWTVDSFMDVYNPPNAVPLILERTQAPAADATWVHTKAMYRFSDESMKVLRGVTPDMCATSALPPGSTWSAGSFAADPAAAATADSAAEQWAELGGGW